MTTQVGWRFVVDRPDEPLEFGACHVHYGWRRHGLMGQKFKSLTAAFQSEKDGLLLLLQAIGGNRTSSANPERGVALFASVWYPDQDWAILCDPTRVTLVRRAQVESLAICKRRNDAVVEQLRSLFEQSPQTVRRELNASFLCGELSCQ